ncbi:MAG: PepSY-associated TM helix domain-containing protein [Hyphomonadaceae bacterium]
MRTAHAWAGAVLSLLIAVLGLSGTLLVFKRDYLRASFAAARADVDYAPERMGAALEAIEARFASEGLLYVTLAGPELGIHKAVFADGGAAYFDQDGALLARWGRNGRIEDWLFDLHHHLLAGETGELVAGVAALAAIMLALTGLIIAAPALRRFAWRLSPRSPSRRDLLASHRDLGLIFAAPILLLALTGAAMVFPDEAKAILRAATRSAPSAQAPSPAAGPGDVNWRLALEEAHAAFPSAAPRIASWPRSANGPASLRLRQPREWHPNGRTYVTIDPATSQAAALADSEALSAGERAFNALYPLHGAFVGGRIYQALSALAGLALAGLGLTGAWAFAARQRRRPQPSP